MKQESSLSAANLHNVPARKPIALDPAAGEPGREAKEGGRGPLGILVSGAVIDKRGVKPGIESKAAARTPAELQIAGRKGQRLLAASQQKRALHWDAAEALPSMPGLTPRLSITAPTTSRTIYESTFCFLLDILIWESSYPVL